MLDPTKMKPRKGGSTVRAGTPTLKAEKPAAAAVSKPVAKSKPKGKK